MAEEKDSHYADDDNHYALVARAEVELKPENLEEEVRSLHDLDARQRSAEINKAGVKAQIAYIWENYGPAYAAQVLTSLLKKD